MTAETAQIDRTRVALERLGLAGDQRDPTIDRVVRVAGYAMAARYAVFSVLAGGEVVHLSSYGANGELDELDLPVVDLLASEQPLVVQDFMNDAVWRQRVENTGCRDAISIISYPIRSPEGTPIGALSILHNRPRFHTTVNRQIMEDLCTLIEDSLLQRSLSIRDPLTQLFNRRYFTALCDSEWRRAQRRNEPISFAVLDVDHFKPYNDAAGHAAGDEVLKTISRLLARSMRRAGDTVCRMGGEEFGVCLPVTELSRAREMMDEVRRSIAALKIRHPAFDKGHVTVSVGVATATTAIDFEGHDPSYYLELADQALYHAKRLGRNRVETPRDPG